jgi:hypothetical protein
VLQAAAITGIVLGLIVEKRLENLPEPAMGRR